MSGARIGELLGEWEGTYEGDDPHPGFLWDDIVDAVAEPYISIVCEKKRKGEKWRRRRNVPFYGGKDGAMAKLVGKLRARWYNGDPKAKVFQLVSLGHGFNAYLTRACRNCELIDCNGEPLTISQHDLRHVFATRCVEAGVTWKALAEWLGHEDGGILAANTYSCLRKEHSFEMAARLGKKKEAVSTPEEPEGILVNGKNFSAGDIEKMAKRLAAVEALLKGE